MTSTFMPLLSTRQVSGGVGTGSHTVAASVVIENPLIAKVNEGHAPFSPPSDPSIVNAPSVASSLICSMRATRVLSAIRVPTA